MKIGKVLIMMSLVIVAGCGGEQHVEQHAAIDLGFVNYTSGTYFNPSPTSVELKADTFGALKMAALNAGDTINEPMVRADAITIAGCLPTIVETPDISVCYETAAQATDAEALIFFLPGIVGTVNGIIGPTGKLDLVLAAPGGSQYNGVFDNSRRVAVVIDSTWRQVIAGTAHELTHAAYQQAGGNLTLYWLNEALATLAETEMGYTRGIPQPGIYSNTLLESKPVSQLDYFRGQQIGLALKAQGKFPVAAALKTSDPLQGITGGNMESFARAFWQDNYQYAPANSSAIPPYGAVKILSPVVGPKSLIRIDG
ncbi:hypothetical protein [Geotalea sp. SG265]|uniref:hypothetical protein n=1 Tax=Geotalea sp. SG265 TaxID=2922867 RepID=UPI001FAECAA4|nr:hypothetical protein [Geotalea sp. SG265]